MPHSDTDVEPGVLDFRQVVDALGSFDLPLPRTRAEAEWLDRIFRARQYWARALYPFPLDPRGVLMGNAEQTQLFAIRFGETEWRELDTLVTGEGKNRRLTLADEPLDVITVVRRPASITCPTPTQLYYVHIPQS